MNVLVRVVRANEMSCEKYLVCSFYSKNEFANEAFVQLNSSKIISTDRKGKVMFSQVFVCPQSAS